ncbi:hypothetical protein LB519_20860 [Mesorhizobium sp. AD1-1]|nr:hypothetical protein [Mesorhizobium sp. AD1-1]MBZ9720297.1 hypothetical protein [Mesorhizobium sp. AD1-1]
MTSRAAFICRSNLSATVLNDAVISFDDLELIARLQIQAVQHFPWQDQGI